MPWSCCCLVMPESKRLGFPGEPVRDLPYAHGGPILHGRLRARPEDFRVEEMLGYPLSGQGEHLVLKVEKRGLNTLEAVQKIARWAGVEPRAVGFAGLKDRNAVALQHFSMALADAQAQSLPPLQEPGLKTIATTRHHRKLRRGQLAGNRFVLQLTQVSGDRGIASERLERIRERGFPNYFGPQRFGNDASNLAGAVSLFCAQAARPKPEQRRMWLSAARSHVFNQVLACRVTDGSWDRALAGEVLIATGDGRQLIAPARSSGLDERIEKAEFDPSGPLPGRVGHCLNPEGAAAEYEAACVAERGLQAWGEALATHGVDAGRRTLRVKPQSLLSNWRDAHTLSLQFGLPAGSYATVLVRELMST